MTTATRQKNKKAAFITAEQAAEERVKREKARRSLMDYATYLLPWYTPGSHHHLVAEHLEQVLRYIETKGAEGIGRLMIFLPPRHGKTEEVSRIFPSWLLGKLPDARVILTSYGADLAQDNSRAVRNYVMDARYQAVFGGRSVYDDPVMISDDSRAKGNWDLAAPYRGGVVAAGIGGAITGKGAHLLIIDDPFKNREEAESDSHREKVATWYRSSAYTRLEDGGAVILMHTRWHREDLAGMLLQQMAQDPFLSDQWKVVVLPALAYDDEDYVQDEAQFGRLLGRGLYTPQADPLGRKAGEPLWPEKYTTADLVKIEANIGSYEYASQYQQQPEPSEGGFFAERDFVLVEDAPKGLRWYTYVDLALGRSETSDYNTALPVAMDNEGHLYYRDMLRVRQLDQFLAQLVEMMLSEKELHTVWGLEDVAFQSLVFKDLMKDRRLARVSMFPIRPEGDKVSRARPLQTRARQGMVRLVKGNWIQAFLNEAAAFPGGKHDDQIDSASGGLLLMSKYSARSIKAKSWQG